jgi:hypothetical protein
MNLLPWRLPKGNRCTTVKPLPSASRLRGAQSRLSPSCRAFDAEAIPVWQLSLLTSLTPLLRRELSFLPVADAGMSG